MVEYFTLSAIALILTIAVETGIAWVFRFHGKTAVLTIVLINVITNPLLNFLLLLNNHFNLISQTFTLTLILEACVVAVEWRLMLWVLRQGTGKTLAVSLVMNAGSFLAGLLLFNGL